MLLNWHILEKQILENYIWIIYIPKDNIGSSKHIWNYSQYTIAFSPADANIYGVLKAKCLGLILGADQRSTVNLMESTAAKDYPSLVHPLKLFYLVPASNIMSFASKRPLWETNIVHLCIRQIPSLNQRFHWSFVLILIFYLGGLY